MKKILKAIGVLLFLLFFYIFYIFLFVSFGKEIREAMDNMEKDSIMFDVTGKIILYTVDSIEYVGDTVMDIIDEDTEACIERRDTISFEEILGKTKLSNTNNEICSKLVNDKDSFNFISQPNDVDINNDGAIDTASCYRSSMYVHCNFDIGSGDSMQITVTSPSEYANLEYNDIFVYKEQTYILESLSCNGEAPHGMNHSRLIKVYKYLNSNNIEDVCYFAKE